MITIEDFKEKKIAVRCKNNNDAEKFLNICYENGLFWEEKQKKIRKDT